jgi:transcriptional regulator with XRE-family HTH domain
VTMGVDADPDPELPLANMLRTARRRRSLSLQEVANRVNREAAADGERGVSTNRKRVHSWEGGEIPRPDALRWLARVLGLDLDELTRAAHAQLTRRQALRGVATVTGTLLLHDPERMLALMSSVGGLDADPAGGVPALSQRLLEDLQAITRHHAQRWGRTAPRSMLHAVRATLGLLRGWLPGTMPSELRRHLQAATAETALLAGWLCRQLDNHGDAAGYWAFARDLAREAGDGSLHAHVLVAISSLYSPVTGRSGGDVRTALRLLDEAKGAAGARCSPSLHSWILARQGEEYAAMGQIADATGHFHRAERLLDEEAPATDSILADWDHERLAHWRAHCVVGCDVHSSAGDVAEAVLTLQRSLSRLDPSRAYDRSRALIELAEGYITQGEIDHACAVLDDSLTLTDELGLVSHRQRVRRVRQRLEPWGDTSAVRLLDARLTLHA